MAQHATARTYPHEGKMGVQVAGVTLVGFGLTLVVMVLAYTRDLAVIAATPEAVWQFICGAPIQGALVLPLLNMLSILALVLGAVLLLVDRRLRR